MGCTSSITGKPKTKFRSHSLARGEMKSVQKQTDVHVQIYKCEECHYWHVGKSNESQAHWLKIRSLKAQDERLVGRLVGALRSALDPTKVSTATSPDPDTTTESQENAS